MVDHPKLANGMKKSLRQSVSEFKAFQGMKIDDASFLDEIEGRMKCPDCLRSRKFFCYTCFTVMDPLVGRIPRIKLPVELAVVKHPLEIDGKSTSIHGVILAPESVKIYSYPGLPDTENSILVFPSNQAEDAYVFLERAKAEFAEKEGEGEEFPYKRVIFVDSTWNQTHKICNDPAFKDVPKVKLSGIESLYWRYQKGNPITFLSTIEAMYHFSVIFHKTVISPDYKGEYDNLLYFFKYMFFKIRQIYDPKTLLSYSTRPYLQELPEKDA